MEPELIVRVHSVALPFPKPGLKMAASAGAAKYIPTSARAASATNSAEENRLTYSIRDAAKVNLAIVMKSPPHLCSLMMPELAPDVSPILDVFHANPTSWASAVYGH